MFVVLAINLEGSSPDAVAATNTSVSSAVTTTSQTAMASLADANTLTRMYNRTPAQGYVDGGIHDASLAMESPPALLDYIGIIATNDFFLSVQGAGNGAAKRVGARVWGYRARADASIYAALVQSEVLSA